MTAKLIAAVEALPRGTPVPTVYLPDVLRLIKEHDPTAAIVRMLEEFRDNQRKYGDDFAARGRDDLKERHHGAADAAKVWVDDLKSGKLEL